MQNLFWFLDEVKKGVGRKGNTFVWRNKSEGEYVVYEGSSVR